jgi:hypothetical protein
MGIYRMTKLSCEAYLSDARISALSPPPIPATSIGTGCLRNVNSATGKVASANPIMIHSCNLYPLSNAASVSVFWVGERFPIAETVSNTSWSCTLVRMWESLGFTWLERAVEATPSPITAPSIRN